MFAEVSSCSQLFARRTSHHKHDSSASISRIAWHGNYVKFIEKDRCALLDKIGYGYLQMMEDGFAFPVADLKIKYVRSLLFGDTARIVSTLIKYENRLKIRYEIYNDKTGETRFVCPDKLIQRVEALL